MNGGSQLAGLWDSRERDEYAEEATRFVGPIDAWADDEPEPQSVVKRADWITKIAAIVCSLLAIGWVALIAMTLGLRLVEGPFSVESLGALIAVASSPLVLIALVYMLIARNSRSEMTRLGQVSAALRIEQARLEASMISASERIEAERNDIADHATQLMTIGDEAAQRLRVVGDKLRSDIAALGRQADSLRTATEAARSDLSVLLADLPKAHGQTREMTHTLQSAGIAAHEQAGALDAQIASLVARGREADEIAGGAAHKLAAHLARVEGVSETAGAHLVTAAETMTGAIDAALDRASQAADAARQGLEAQGAAMLALVDQGEAALARTGAGAAESVAKRVEDVTERIEALGVLLREHSVTSERLITGIEGGIERVDAKFAVIDSDAATRNDRLVTALAKMSEHSSDLAGTLSRGSESAEAMIGRAETLITVLDSVAREVDETLPAAFARLDGHTEASRARIASAAPEVSRIEREAAAALDRLVEAEGVLAKQRAALDAFVGETEKRMGSAKKIADQLVATVEKADSVSLQIAQGSSVQLVEAMARVRETSQAAAARAREALAEIVPQSAELLSEAMREALSEGVAQQVEARVAELAETANKAVATAHSASDRLMRQMLTIADTSAQVEARIAEARAEIEENDRDNFARRVALLIESLNSTAIDVTKIRSNDVTDSAWQAYLRGDRGVFTRRAVRLLDSGEVREVARHYGEEPEFREQVNRYVHDFEGMLRNVLATRDGSTLGITLLSSDMGKLYVALAQAIERLRT